MNLQKLAALALLVGVAGCSGPGAAPSNAEIVQALVTMNGSTVGVPDHLDCTKVGAGTEGGLPYWDMDCKNFGGPRDSRIIRAWRLSDGKLNATATGA